MRMLSLVASLVAGVLLVATVSYAWTAPPASPPNSNVAAPVNVGANPQTKNGTLGMNGLAVFGNSILQASSYLNWGATTGSTGYGIRDNAGILEFKNTGATGGPLNDGWKSLQTIISDLVGSSIIAGTGTINYVSKFTGASTLGNSLIYDTGTNVGIGTGSSPAGKLEVRHTTGTQTELLRLRSNMATWQSYGLLTFVDDATGLVESQIKTELVLGGADATKRTLSLGTKGNLNTLNMYNGNVGVGTMSPAQKLQVIGNVQADGFFHNSDRSLKDNISTISGLGIISQIRGVEYNWKKDGTKSAGVIAQEIESVLPEAVHTDATGIKSVDYDALIAPLIEAVKELEAQNKTQEKHIEDLQTQIFDLKRAGK